jgi:hypothetical protein
VSSSADVVSPTDRSRDRWAQLAVVVWALVAATYSQYATLTNWYVVNGDVPNGIYWMQRFRDAGLFRDDLMTDFTVRMHGQWGLVEFYRAVALVADPLLISRFMPLPLLAIFAWYVYALVRRFSTTYGALVAAGLAAMMPTYLELMSGGHGRAFALPLLAAFVYYLATGARLTACIVLVVLSLFYPMASLICAITYGLALVAPPWTRATLKERAPAAALFAVAMLVLGAAFVTRYTLAPDPRIGPIVTRAEMEGRPEFYAGGRAPVLPTAGIPRQMRDQLVGFVRAATLDYPSMVLGPQAPLLRKLFVGVPLLAIGLAAVVIFLVGLFKRRVALPGELAALILAGMVMYVVADVLLFRLYIPDRYLAYPIHIAGLVATGIAVGYAVNQIRAVSARRAVQVVLLLAMAARVDLAKDVGLADLSANQPLYEFLETLPADSVVASHPDLGDYIPTFSRKTVFVHFELSQPFFTTYWATMTGRITSLFDAYYAPTRREVHDFCVRNGIDYLVVRTRDFDPQYLATHRIYFNPFDAYVRERLQGRQTFALNGIDPAQKLFQEGDVFVISARSLGDGPPQSARDLAGADAPIVPPAAN